MGEKVEVNEYTHRYIEICTIFDPLFSLSRKLCGKTIKDIIDKLEILIKKKTFILEKFTFIYKHNLNKWNRRPFLNQIFIEDFIKQVHQFRMIDERTTTNMRDRVIALIDQSKIESILLNDEVKSNIKQVVVEKKEHEAKRKMNNLKSERKKYVMLVLTT